MDPNSENDNIPLLDSKISSHKSFHSIIEFFKKKWRYILIIIGGIFASLVAGSTNAFNVFSESIQNTNSISDTEMNLIAGLGLIGIYFVVPAGWAFDSYGPFKTALFGSFLTFSGYFGISFTPTGSWWIILLGLTLVGFGSGAVFLAVLGTAISASPTGGGFGVSFVASGMSLSIAFIIYFNVLIKFLFFENCDDCWKDSFRGIAGLVLIFMVPGSLTLFFFRKEDYPHLIRNQELRNTLFFEEITEDEEEIKHNPEKNPKEGIDNDNSKEKYNQNNQQRRNKNYNDEESNKEYYNEDNYEDKEIDDLSKIENMSLLESLKIALKSPVFYILFFSYFCGISSAVFVLTQTSKFWDDYDPDHSLKYWKTLILTLFSVFNAIGNFFSGILSDQLSKRKIISHHTFIAITQLIFSLIFLIISFIVHFKIKTVVTALLLSSIGFGFGTYLVLYPIVIADIYGASNFGKYFGYLQIASSIASLGTPQLAIQIYDLQGNYTLFLYIISGMLFMASFLMFLQSWKSFFGCSNLLK